MLGVVVRGIKATQRNTLIADHPFGAIARCRVHAPGVEIRFGPSDKERPGLMQAIERIDGAVQIEGKRLIDIEFACPPDEQRRQIGPNAPVARLVGIGQRRALDGRTKTHRIQLGGVG